MPHHAAAKAPARPSSPVGGSRLPAGPSNADPIKQLREQGVSIWLDTLSRDLLETGTFESLVREQGITGATSNPTIFANAISSSDRYDHQLQAALDAGTRDPQQLFFELALTDVRRAATLLRPPYQASDGSDGFVSFECTPDLADDTDATIAQAQQLWQRLSLPNVMIKVPATQAGIPAIEELTSLGININVTLLFSVKRYEQAIDAYLTGLERRATAGKQLHTIASVASFFVSRLDSKADPLLPADSPLHGKIAIANANRAYQHQLRRFTGSRWDSLQARGARPQRLLWASTATKNPTYPDLMYVEQLIATNVINTMPEHTLHALVDHGRIERTLHADANLAEATLRQVGDTGLDLDTLTTQLEHEGIHAFNSSYHQLLNSIQTRARSTP